jgi:hypothetical protein
MKIQVLLRHFDMVEPFAFVELRAGLRADTQHTHCIVHSFFFFFQTMVSTLTAKNFRTPGKLEGHYLFTDAPPFDPNTQQQGQIAASENTP